MDQLTQPFVLMSLASMKKNDMFQLILTFCVIFLPYLSRVIPYDDISENIKVFLKKNDHVSITISTYDVPVVRSFSQNSFTKLVYSKTFLAIVYYLTKNCNMEIESLTEIMTSNTDLNMCYDNKSENSYIFIPLENSKILISKEDKIYCELTISKNKDDTSSEDNKTKTNVAKKKNLTIVLSIKKDKTRKNQIGILKRFIDTCVEEYDLFIRTKKNNDSNQYIFEYKSFEKDDERKIELKFDEVIMEHNKDINTNIFFEGKEKMINYIKPFIYNPYERINVGEEKYKRSGFTFKAGMLFYGSPGCGKTSTIKAILKYTGRHGIIINLSKIKTCDELQNIFRKRRINDRELSGKQICYILEDCDAFEDNIIQTRKKNEKEDIYSYSEVTNISKIVEEINSSTVKILSKNDDQVNLSCFLNILDGIIELHGVMIIMTTNYPEKIDEALIRPGRFDFKHEFKKASRNIIIEMLKFKYELSDKEIAPYIEHFNIKDEILSPAEVQSITFKNDNIKDCINEIMMVTQH